MIELYVLGSLGVIGYLINKSTEKVKPELRTNEYNKRNVIEKGEKNSSINMYESKRVQDVQKIEQKKAARMHEASKDPVKTRVIPQIKSLTGEYVNPDSFTHNNMTPFFGRSVKQNMADNATKNVMENYTGVGDLQKSKCEAPSFFDVSKNLGNVYGFQNQNDILRSHIVEPRIRQNEMPFDKTYVGPGIGKGFTSAPDGGYHQYEIQDIVRPKCVDELRTVNNPKESYKGRIVNGLKSGMPSEKANIGEMNKNRPERVYEQGEEKWFTTTGAYLKPTEIPDFDLKDTNRLESVSYIGGAVRAEGKEGLMEGEYCTPPFKEQFGEFGAINPVMIENAPGLKDDYGKNTILVYNNERQITGVRVQQGNVTSMIKSIIAPIMDAIKITKKDSTVDNPRHFGNAAPQIPTKSPVKDPNDVARTTLKESLIHDSVPGIIKGNTKHTVYDPNQVARRTIKETTIHDSVPGSIKGIIKHTVYDPNQVARTTIKETTIHDAVTGPIKGAVQVAVYDPDEIVAKVTGRQTLDNITAANIAGVKKSTVHDPNDVARTTLKETLVDNERDGNIEALEGIKGGYENAEYTAPNTQKQYTSDYDYYGNATRDGGEGYLTNPKEAKNTQKQYTSDYDYYGGAGSKDKKSMSTENIQNARVNVSQEMLLHQREPTTTSAKVYTTSDDIHVRIKKDAGPTMIDSLNYDKVYQEPNSAEDTIHITRGRKEVEHIDDRLDPSVLASLSQNPYAISINK